jgi:HSP20 family molecular chaperone IbpA
MKKILLSKVGLAILFFALGLGGHYLYTEYQSGNLEDHIDDLKDKAEDITQSDWISDQIEKMSDEIEDNIDVKDSFFDEIFSEDYFDKLDEPFEEMEKARRKLNKKFRKLDSKFNSKFNGWFKRKFGGGRLKDIKTREDESFVYYELEMDGVLENQVDIQVSNKWIKVSGIVKKKEESKNPGFFSSREYHSSFKRILPVPKNVDGSSSKVIVEKGKITIKFPKNG